VRGALGSTRFGFDPFPTVGTVFFWMIGLTAWAPRRPEQVIGRGHIVTAQARRRVGRPYGAVRFEFLGGPSSSALLELIAGQELAIGSRLPGNDARSVWHRGVDSKTEVRSERTRLDADFEHTSWAMVGARSERRRRLRPATRGRELGPGLAGRLRFGCARWLRHGIRHTDRSLGTRRGTGCQAADVQAKDRPDRAMNTALCCVHPTCMVPRGPGAS